MNIILEQSHVNRIVAQIMQMWMQMANPGMTQGAFLPGITQACS